MDDQAEGVLFGIVALYLPTVWQLELEPD